MAKSNKLPDLSVAQIEEMLTHIDANLPRNEWVNVAMGLHSELGDAGFDLFDRWSSTGAGYKHSSCKHVWDSLEPGAISIGTVVRLAKEGGYSLDPSKIEPMDAAAVAARNAHREAHAAEAARIRREKQAEARERSIGMWSSANPCVDHPYLKSKQVKPYGLKVGAFSMRRKPREGDKPDQENYFTIQDCLLIPLMDMSGEIQMLQAIPAKKPGWMESTGKLFTQDGDKIGHFFPLGSSTETIAFCEGYATAATIHEVTGWQVIVCFDEGNILPVVKQFAKELTGTKFVICGDNDQWTKGNPGQKTAREAANLVKGRAVVPRFTDETIAANMTRDEKGKEKGPTDFNDLFVLEGAEAVTRQLSEKVVEMPMLNRKNDSPPPQSNEFANESFMPLGYNEGVYYYLSRATGQITPLKPTAHTQLNLLQLATQQWWLENYPLPGQKIDWGAAADDLMQMCHQRGIFTTEQIRGRGAWWDDGRAVFHFGPHLEVDGDKTDLLDMATEFTYQKQLNLGVPSADRLTKEDGMRILTLANAFRWRVPASAALLAGYVALAPVCGALGWRPHVWITGGAGCGKTTVLNRFCKGLLGRVVVFAQGNSTEAGIRQKLRNDALPVIFDETESNNEREAMRVQNILSMVRQASSESGAQTYKGSGTGDVMEYTIRSMFCFASIQVALKQQADLERLTVLQMRGKNEVLDTDLSWDDLKAMINDLRIDREMPARLFRRSLDLLPVTLQNIQTFVDAASDHFGTVREGDQYGTLLAGAWSLVSDDLVTPQQALEEIKAYEWGDITENARMDEPQEALQRVLMLTMRTSSNVEVTLQAVATQAAGRGISAGIDQKDAERMLATIGMRWGADGLIVHNNNAWIERRLRDTKFAAGWRDQLLRVDGVHRMMRQYKIGGVNSRCILIPKHFVLEDSSQQDLI